MPGTRFYPRCRPSLGHFRSGARTLACALLAFASVGVSGCKPGVDLLKSRFAKHPAATRPAWTSFDPSSPSPLNLRPSRPLSEGTDLSRYVDDLLQTAMLRSVERYANAYEPFEAIEDLVPNLHSARFNKELDPIEAHFNAGEELFEIELSQVPGFGSGEGGKPPAMHRVHRGAHGGPDTTSCRSCHHRGGDDGAGEYTEAALTGGDGMTVASAAERNPPPLGGGGVVQILAAEISAALADQARPVAQSNAYDVDLSYQGVDFGTLRILPGNGRDTSKLKAIDPDLIVRPFGWKGTHSTLRRFAEEAFQVHHGIQSSTLVSHRERFGPMPMGTSPATAAVFRSLGTGADDDPDNDKRGNELFGSHLMAISVYLALLPMPVIDPPRSPDLLAAWRDGAATFTSVGCESCHKPMWKIKNPVWRERGEAEACQTTIDLDMRKDIRNGPSLRNLDTTVYDLPVFLFSDLRRHDMGAELADSPAPPVSDDVTKTLPHFSSGDRSGPSIPPSYFLTRPLWGLADSGPYLHDGRAVTLHDAIVLHGGEAEKVRAAYQKLPVEKQRALQIFLMSLARQALPEVSP